MKYVWIAVMLPVFAAYYLLGTALLIWLVEWLSDLFG